MRCDRRSLKLNMTSPFRHPKSMTNVFSVDERPTELACFLPISKPCTGCFRPQRAIMPLPTCHCAPPKCRCEAATPLHDWNSSPVHKFHLLNSGTRIRPARPHVLGLRNLGELPTEDGPTSGAIVRYGCRQGRAYSEPYPGGHSVAPTVRRLLGNFPGRQQSYPTFLCVAASTRPSFMRNEAQNASLKTADLASVSRS